MLLHLNDKTVSTNQSLKALHDYQTNQMHTSQSAERQGKRRETEREEFRKRKKREREAVINMSGFK